jgi:hypothetical protein
MGDEKKRSSESINESLKALHHAIELAHDHGVRDGKLAEAAYYVMEAGWRMMLIDSEENTQSASEDGRRTPAPL